MNMLETLLPIIAIVLFAVVNTFLKRRTAEKTETGKATSLLTEINQNLLIAKTFAHGLRAKKFKIGSWNRNKAKLDFLDERLHTALVNTFSMAEEFNREIDAAKTYKSSSYLANMDVDKLRESLTKSKQGLDEWFAANKDKKELMPKKRGLFG